MSRLNQSLVVEREEFVRNLFKANPELTGIAAQGLLTEKYGQMMRPNRLYDLKTEVLKKTSVKPKKVGRQKDPDVFASLRGRIRVPEGYETIMVPMLVLKR